MDFYRGLYSKRNQAGEIRPKEKKLMRTSMVSHEFQQPKLYQRSTS